MKDLLTLAECPASAIRELIDLAIDFKRRPEAYRDAMQRRTLIMLFEKPSLRTRVSFETAMTRMGGHAIYYDLGRSPFGGGKETIEDTARTLSRYVDLIMARLFEHDTLVELARHATVPVVNGLTNDAHPTQVLADLQTIVEHKGRLAGLKLAYLGDGHNNVTHSLLAGCAKVGMHITVGCPEGAGYSPDPQVLRKAAGFAKRSGAQVVVTHDAAAAVKDADAVYTDSWMSYHIPTELKEERLRIFMPYQVSAKLMRKARRNAIFMHCLPATRGLEQAAEVIDGPQSVVFDEAENRLHMHAAILLRLLGQGIRK